MEAATVKALGGAFPIAMLASWGFICACMVPSWLEKLLILQERDQKCDRIEGQLARIPEQISKEQREIERMEAAVVSLEEEGRELERQRAELEGQVSDAEEAIRKYKTQQMQVKRNEEYAALTKEIDTLQDRISALEDDILAILDKIELHEQERERQKEETEQQVATLRAHIGRLERNRESYAADLESAREAVRACGEEIEPAMLEQYRYIKGQIKRPPVIAVLEGGRCRGCHLKVSGDVDSAVRKGRELVRCDSCGRILYAG